MDVPLKEHIESRLQAIEKSIAVADDVMQSRLAGMNEFRDTLRDQATKFITRDEVGILLQPIQNTLEELKESKARLAGKAEQSQVNIALIMGSIGLVMAVITFIMGLK
jgi:DNA repair exonuclease SbcCD ATPase subunit